MTEHIELTQPTALLLAIVVIPLLIAGWRAMATVDMARRIMALALRAVMILGLAFILAGPHMKREHNHLTVIGLVDVSGSVQRFADFPPPEDDPDATRAAAMDYVRQWFRTATESREPDDRFGLVVFNGKAIALSAPTTAEYVDDNLGVAMAQGTDISQAVRLALAMFPANTARRMVLVTDGNETAGDVREEFQKFSAPTDVSPESTSATIPVDVLPVVYRVTRDVQVSRIEAPPMALAGQTITVRIILDAASPTTGRLHLRRESTPIDLNGSLPGTARQVDLPAGQSVHLASVELGKTPINRFEAVFEADNPSDNVLPDNDRAEAFTATPSAGSVLVLDSSRRGNAHWLTETLRAADLPAETRSPADLPADLLSLQNHDLIILDNISGTEISHPQQELLVKYVTDLGGGLIMSGGPSSFGAGGWTNAPLAFVLPVNLDPPKELRLPKAALVLVLDKSGSMNQRVAGARASQQEIANEAAALAIESLRADTLVGVVTFDFFAHEYIKLQRNDDPQRLADTVRNIQADGGTNLKPALFTALKMLRDVDVEKKRVVCLSDGRSHDLDLDGIVGEMSRANIQLTTIAVGDGADFETLEHLADLGGGEFYPVRDPRVLPRVLIDSVQVINRPLLKEGAFLPQIVPTGSTLTAGMESAPSLNGLVITSLRDDAVTAVEMLHPEGEPLLVHWQAGLGRVAAFTSTAPGTGSWAESWIDWPIAESFWTQLARTIARPASDATAELTTFIDGDSLTITLDMTAAGDDSLIDFLQVDGLVYRPDGETIPVRLQQAGPGIYETTVEATQAGNYVVALNPRRGNRRLPPVIGGTNRSTSPEFRRYVSNLALLEEIVEATGGRRLDIANPRAIDLFDRTSMPISFSMLPIWRSLAWLVLSVLILDVACRRIAWDAAMIRQWIAHGLARVTPARVRAAHATTTLESLRSSGRERLTRRPTDIPAQRPVRVDSEEIEESQPLPPEPSKVAEALETYFTRGRTPHKPDREPESPSRSTKDATDAERTTQNLLEAKRRARRALDDKDR